MANDNIRRVTLVLDKRTAERLLRWRKHVKKLTGLDVPLSKLVRSIIDAGIDQACPVD